VLSFCRSRRRARRPLWWSGWASWCGRFPASEWPAGIFS